MLTFFDLTLEELETTISSLGKEKYRSKQLYKWVYNRGLLTFDDMTNIPKSLRVLFGDMFDMTLPLIKETELSRDGSIKFVFSLHDGNVAESVYIPEEKRNTICLSTQVGCKMGCRFCVTGKIGFVRNLSVGEIIGQVVAVRKYLEEGEGIGEQVSLPPRITNIVFMGMGEPIDNMENVLIALNILNDPSGLDFSHRKITLSSVGLVDGLKIIEPRVASIAISLNAADNETRSYLMPINRIYPIERIVSFAKGFNPRGRTRVTFEYVMLRGVNDSLKDAKLLVETLRGVRCKINLIPLNESPLIEFKTPEADVVDNFHQYLLRNNFTVIVRKSRGGDVGGACGQLGMSYLKEMEDIQ